MLLTKADEANHAADHARDQYDTGDILYAEAMAMMNVLRATPAQGDEPYPDKAREDKMSQLPPDA